MSSEAIRSIIAIRPSAADSGSLDKLRARQPTNPPVITGFNTDVKFRGVVYHVQTEDKGPQIRRQLRDPHLQGRRDPLASRRSPDGDVVADPADEAAITKLMEDQHKGMMMEVKRGKYEPASERTILEDLSLDEIVLAYRGWTRVPAPPSSGPSWPKRIRT